MESGKSAIDSLRKQIAERAQKAGLTIPNVSVPDPTPIQPTTPLSPSNSVIESLRKQIADRTAKSITNTENNVINQAYFNTD